MSCRRALRGLVLSGGVFLAHELASQAALAAISLPETVAAWLETALLNIGLNATLFVVFIGVAAACNLHPYLSFSRPPWRVVVGWLVATSLCSAVVMGGATAVGVMGSLTVARASSFVYPGMFLAAGATSVFTAVYEETLFRGLIQSILVDHTGTRVGLVVASSLFMLAHLSVISVERLGGKLYLTGAFAFGLLLGWVYLRYETLVVPIIIHTVYNVVFFWSFYVVFA